jgi:hypothetical protein
MKIKFNKNLFLKESVVGREYITIIEVHPNTIWDVAEIFMTANHGQKHYATLCMNKEYTQKVWNLTNLDFEVINEDTLLL